MKTHVIQLEPHDDLVSIRDKMSWAKTPRILLVWSARRRRARLSEVDLTVLNRHAPRLGARLGLVTSQTGLRRMAERAQIPVFRTTAEAQRAEWTAPHRLPLSASPAREGRDGSAVRNTRLALNALRRQDPLRVSNPAARVAFFSLGVLSVMMLALLFVPSAEVRVQPVSQTQALTLTVSASPEAQSPSLSGSVPAYVKTVGASGSASIPASGSLLVPDTFAHGSVILTNLTPDALSVPEGTVLVAGGEIPARIATDGAAELEAGSSVEVPVRALQAGARGNLPAGTPLALEGALGLSLSATLQEPLSGGRDRRQPAPSEDDRTRLYARLSAALLEEARAQALSSPDVSFVDTLALAQTMTEDYAPAPGGAGAELSLDLAQDFQVGYASRADLETLGRAALDASLPPGYEAASSTITLIPLSQPVTGSDGVTRWQVRVERSMRSAIRPDEVIERVRGQSVSRAQAALGALLLARAPEIRVEPAWFPFLPLIPLRISVETGL